VPRIEKFVERFARNRENLVERLIFSVDVRHKRRRGKVDAGDAAVCPAGGPSRTAAVGDGEIFLMTPSLTNEIGFQCFQAFAVGGGFSREAALFAIDE
jgi:hypothetical protein